jgi:hypothetical protein
MKSKHFFVSYNLGKGKPFSLWDAWAQKESRRWERKTKQKGIIGDRY